MLSLFKAKCVPTGSAVAVYNILNKCEGLCVACRRFTFNCAGSQINAMLISLYGQTSCDSVKLFFRGLVEKKLVACVNIIPGVKSM